MRVWGLLFGIGLLASALAWEEKVMVEEEMTKEERRELDLEIELADQEAKEAVERREVKNHEKRHDEMCKKGVAMTAAYYMCDDLKVLDHICWFYDWKAIMGLLKNAHVTCSSIPHSHFVPTVFTYEPKKRVHVSFLTDDFFIIFYNEPMRYLQANLLPEQAAVGYMKQQKQVGPFTKLGSPSASACKRKNKKCMMSDEDWLDTFFANCEDCRFDFMTAHHYSCVSGYTIRYLTKLYNRYQLPIWINEFACFDHDMEVVKTYMKEMLEFLEVTPWIERYSWYMARIGAKHKHEKTASLLAADSSTLTELGELYNSWPSQH